MLEEGKYKVSRIAGCFVPEAAEGKTQSFAIEFELENGQEITWTAYLSDKEFMKDGKPTTMAKENTETLVKLGFVGRSFADLADTDKAISDLFVPVDNINILVEHEEYTKESGETVTFAKVKYINVGYGVNKMDKKQAVVKFKSLGLDGHLLKLQKELKVKRKEDPKPESSKEQEFESDDIPF